jgi:hypothetical protein
MCLHFDVVMLIRVPCSLLQTDTRQYSAYEGCLQFLLMQVAPEVMVALAAVVEAAVVRDSLAKLSFLALASNL